MDPAWLWVAEGGERNPQPQTAAYLERPKGHSKTTDFAVMIAWVLYASPRKLLGLAAAGDLDQAKLLCDGIDTLLRGNAWLCDKIELNKYEVRNRFTGSVVKIMAADAHTSHGPTPDFVIVDEITNWKNNLKEFWESIYAATAKRTPCVAIVIANAGLGQGSSWQWKVAKRPERARDGTFTAWTTSAPLGWTGRRSSRSSWSFLPTRPTGDCGATCGCRRGRCARPGRHRRLRDDGGAAMEPPATRDDGGRDVAVYRRARFGDQARPFGLLSVGSEVRRSPIAFGAMSIMETAEGRQGQGRGRAERNSRVHEQYHINKLLYDPNQAEYAVEVLQREGIHCEEMPFVGRHLNLMASTIVETFRTRIIDLYPMLEANSGLEAVDYRREGFRDEAGKRGDGGRPCGYSHSPCHRPARSLCRDARESVQAQSPDDDLRVEQLDAMRHGVQLDRRRYKGRR